MLIKAFAKVNLTLDVTGKRSDGYHDLRSLMHTIDMYDEVELVKSDAFSFECNEPLPSDNTAMRAAMRYFTAAGLDGGVHILLTKHIPSEAGLGGASADAAGVLRGLQTMYGALSEPELFSVARSVGADVPFCLHGGAALAEGIGEKLTPIKRQPLSLLVVKPAEGVSTKMLFSALRLPVKHPSTESAIEAYNAFDLQRLGNCMENALEPTAALSVPSIIEIKRRMLSCGALGSCMTGSGSAVIGLFESTAAAKNAADNFGGLPFVAIG